MRNAVLPTYLSSAKIYETVMKHDLSLESSKILLIVTIVFKKDYIEYL